MDATVLGDPTKRISNNFVKMLSAYSKICPEQWRIGTPGGRESWLSLQSARLDDDEIEN